MKFSQMYVCMYKEHKFLLLYVFSFKTNISYSNMKINHCSSDQLLMMKKHLLVLSIWIVLFGISLADTDENKKGTNHVSVFSGKTNILSFLSKKKSKAK